MANITLNSNEYFTGLVNWILHLRQYATNTSNKQRTITDVFATETLDYGDQKAFLFAELPKVEDYSQTSSLLTQKPIKYSEEFIGAPIKKKISLSRVEPFLKMAMMNSSGMAFFISYIVGLMESAKDNYLYGQIMSDLINWTPSITANKQMNQSVTLIDTSKMTDYSEILAARQLNQENLELAWQKVFDDFQIYSDIFIDVDNATNGTNFQTAVKLSDLVFIGNAKYLNERVISLMATMLKSDVINKDFQTPPVLKIPQSTFDKNNKGDIVGFVAHKKWYQWFYHFLFMGNFLDIDTMMIKNVLHFWYSKGRLKNLPAMKLVAA